MLKSPGNCLRKSHHSDEAWAARPALHSLVIQCSIAICVIAVLVVFPSPAYSQHLAGITGTNFDVDLYGNIYVISSLQHTLQLFSHEGKTVDEIGGTGWENDQFDSPAAVWARNGIDIFVADYGNHRIQRFDRNLNYISTLHTRDRTSPEERFGYPTDVALSRLGDLYVCDSENARVVKFDSQNKVTAVFGGFDAGKGRLLKPRQLEIGPEDRVYVLDDERVMVFDTFGNFIQEIDYGLTPGRTTIFADETGLVVVNDSTIYLFDDKDRLITTTVVPEGEMLGGKAVHAISVSQSFMYCLTDSGLTISANPRVGIDESLKK